MRYFILAAILTLGVAVFLASSVQALTVSPVKFEISGDPGQTLKGELKLFNEQDTTKTFYSSFESFEARGETGTPYFFPGTEGLATWMSTDPQVTLEPQERKIIPFSIVVPENADPGGHFAAIFWSASLPQTQEGGQVSVSAKLGVLILLRVTGEIEGEGGLLEFASKDKQRVFISPPIHFEYRFQNSGGDRVKPEGEIKIKNIFGMTKIALPANPRLGNVLPNSIRKFKTVWELKENGSQQEAEDNGDEKGFFTTVKTQWINFAFGLYTAKLNINFGTENEEASAKYRFFVIPWQLLTIFVFILAIIWVLIKKYNQWIIKKARSTVS